MYCDELPNVRLGGYAAGVALDTTLLPPIPRSARGPLGSGRESVGLSLAARCDDDAGAMLLPVPPLNERGCVGGECERRRKEADGAEFVISPSSGPAV